MSELLACPFCREMFAIGETQVCPNCDIQVVPLRDLPPSHEAMLEDELPPVSPEDEPFPMAHLGRNRGSLLLLSVLGILTFFLAPWIHQSAPEIVTWSGFEFAQRLPWLWAAGIAWLILLALVLSRRTIRQMRGARLATALMGVMVVTTVALRIGIQPTPHPLVALRYEWGWGMYLAGLLGVAAALVSIKFGGSPVDMPTKQHHRVGDETLH